MCSLSFFSGRRVLPYILHLAYSHLAYTNIDLGYYQSSSCVRLFIWFCLSPSCSYMSPSCPIPCPRLLIHVLILLIHSPSCSYLAQTCLILLIHIPVLPIPVPCFPPVSQLPESPATGTSADGASASEKVKPRCAICNLKVTFSKLTTNKCKCGMRSTCKRLKRGSKFAMKRGGAVAQKRFYTHLCIEHFCPVRPYPCILQVCVYNSTILMCSANAYISFDHTNVYCK